MKENNNIYKKLTEARKILLQKEIKKSATNNFAKFKYMELADLIPPIEEVCSKVGILIVTSFTNEEVITKVIDHENGETIEFTSPFSTNFETGQIKGAQKVGALHTYFRRYMLMLVFEIIEHDAIDAMDNTPKKKNLEIERENAVENLLEKQKQKFKDLVKEHKIKKEKIIEIVGELNSKTMNVDEWDKAILKIELFIEETSF